MSKNLEIESKTLLDKETYEKMRAAFTAKSDFIQKNYYFDTVSLSRQIFDLPSHKLNTVCQALEVSLNHHEAGSDAYGCLMIVLKAMEVLGEYDIDKLLKKTAVYLAHNK